jgi:hypothetical protein
MTTIIDGTAGITFPVTAGSASAVQASSGRVLQVVQGSYSTVTSSSDTSNFSDTGLSASITPSSSSSKILVFVVIPTSASTTYYNGAQFALIRASTSVLSLVNTDRMPVSGLSYANVNTTMQYLDSPSTTSSTTYKVSFKVISGGSGTIAVQHDSNASIIILMEIAA